MIASVGVIELRSAKPVATVMPRLPMAMPMMAVINGRPAATSEPKVMARTTAAMPMPMSSVTPPGISASAAAVPLTWTFSPASRPISAAAAICSRIVSSTSPKPPSNGTVTKPTVRSGLSGDSAAASASAVSSGLPCCSAAAFIRSTRPAFAATGSTRTAACCSGVATAGSILAAAATLSMPRIAASTSFIAARFCGSSRVPPSGAANT